MTDSKLLDSSAWLAYFYGGSEEIKSTIESDTLLLTSAISIFEIKNKLMKDKIDSIKLKNSLEFVKKRSLIVDIGCEIGEEAVETSIKNGLHTVDALIYASALKNNSLLVTFDRDFDGLKNVLILKH